MGRIASLVAVLAAATGLAACGDSSTSKKSPPAAPTGQSGEIVRIIKDFGSHPARLCTQYATPRLLKRQFGSRANCLRGAKTPGARDPRVKVDSVQIHGSRATAVRTSGTNPGAGTQSTIRLVRQSGRWRVELIVPRSPASS